MKRHLNESKHILTLLWKLFHCLNENASPSALFQVGLNVQNSYGETNEHITGSGGVIDIMEKMRELRLGGGGLTKRRHDEAMVSSNNGL